MGNEKNLADGLFHGLESLSATAFPKKCQNCGHVFHSEQEYIKATESIQPTISGLKQSFDDQDNKIIELFRNCVCGSTLLEFFSDRRDDSDAGVKRRETFGRLLNMLIDRGVEREVARKELVKILYGEKSALIDGLLDGLE